MRALICPELRKRVDFHVTRYYGNRAKSGMITVDGKKVLEFSYHRFVRESNGHCGVVRRGERFGVWSASGNQEYEWSPFHTDAIHPPQQLGDAMRSFLSMLVRSALRSPNPLIRSLAIVDRRLGRRRLERLKITERHHSLVREFYQLRMSVLGNEKAGPMGPASSS